MIQHYELLALTLPESLSLETTSTEFCINNQGWVAGSARQDNQNVAFWYDGHLVQTIPILRTASAIVKAINDTGHIVGHIVPQPGTGTRMRSFVLHGEHLDIVKDDEGSDSFAIAVNNQGHTLVRHNGWESFIATQQGLYPLDPTGTYRLQANSINDTDSVVGVGYVHDQKPRSGGAFRWSNGTVSFIPKLEIGPIEKRISAAYDINNAGQIVGMSGNIKGTRHAFLSNEGEVYDLGTVGSWWSYALAINNHGASVGYTSQPHQLLDFAQALLWQHRTLVNLNDYTSGSGWDLKVALDINDKGQIVGVGELDGVLRIFLMNPVR